MVCSCVQRLELQVLELQTALGHKDKQLMEVQHRCMYVNPSLNIALHMFSQEKNIALHPPQRPGEDEFNGPSLPSLSCPESMQGGGAESGPQSDAACHGETGSRQVLPVRQPTADQPAPPHRQGPSDGPSDGPTPKGRGEGQRDAAQGQLGAERSQGAGTCTSQGSRLRPSRHGQAL